MSPYENVIVSNSFEEIVFSNRNKEYGAYVLRKRQKKYVLVAFSLAFFFVASSVLTPFILNQYKKNVPKLTGTGPVVVDLDSTLNFELPKPPEINTEPTARFVVPNVVDTVDNTEIQSLSTMDDLLATVTNPDPPTTIEVVPENDQIIEVEERPFISVDIPAQFEGGDINNFNKWVAKNIKYPQLAVENGITGRVYVQFVVNSKGKVEKVTILRGTDPLLDQEAIRVIESSPLWSAPQQGGRPVKQLFSLPVIFKLEQ